MAGPDSLDPRKKSTRRLRTPEEPKAQAEAEQRIPGTESYRITGGGPVGQKAIEADSPLGHDNLEKKTEIEKEGDQDQNTPEGSLRSPK